MKQYLLGLLTLPAVGVLLVAVIFLRGTARAFFAGRRLRRAGGRS